MEDQLIREINDEYLITVISICSTSCMELLSECEFKSREWLLHTSGLSYGIWISICDPEFISLSDVEEVLNEFILSKLN